MSEVVVVVVVRAAGVLPEAVRESKSKLACWQWRGLVLLAKLCISTKQI